MDKTRIFLSALRADITKQVSNGFKPANTTNVDVYVRTGASTPKDTDLEEGFVAALDYIMLYDDLKDIVSNRKYMHKLNKIRKIITDPSVFTRKMLTILNYARIVEYLVHLLQQTFECMAHITFKTQSIARMAVHREHGSRFCSNVDELFYNTVIIVSRASKLSRLFCVKFEEKNGIDIVLGFLHEIEATLGLCSSSRILSILLHMLLIVYNWSKSLHFEEGCAATANAVLLPLAHRMREQNFNLFTDHYLLAYLVIMKTASEPVVFSLLEKTMLLKLVDLLKISVRQIENSATTMRISLDFDVTLDINGPKVCWIQYNEIDFTIIDLLDTLFYTAVNDNLKLGMFVDYGLLDDAKKIILSGNDIETEYCVRLLYQLSFEPRVASLLAEDEIFKSMINKIISYQYPNENLLKYCEGLVFMLENRTSEVAAVLNDDDNDEEQLTTSCYASRINLDLDRIDEDDTDLQITGVATEDVVAKPPSQTIRHNTLRRKSAIPISNIMGMRFCNRIMLSHDGHNVSLYIQIKIDLENYGIRVNLNDMNSSFEDTVQMIKESDFILMCITHKFKLNPNCRFEYQYALHAKKIVLPLIIQDYAPDGWLKNMRGKRIYLSLTSDKQMAPILIKQLMPYLAVSADALEFDEQGDRQRRLSESSFKSNKKIDIMISAHYKNHEVVTQIKNVLESWNLVVWMGIEKIQGWHLRSVSHAVKNNNFFLICLTEDYENSSSCRHECLSAYSSNKPILPIVLQKNYKPVENEWIGRVLDKSESIDFSDANLFTESVKTLRKRLVYHFPHLAEDQEKDDSK